MSGPPMADDRPAIAQDDDPGRIKRATAWSKATAERAGGWAIEARETHATVDVGFRAADLNRRVAAMVLAGGIAYRIFFWLLALSLIVGGVLGFFDPSEVEQEVDDQGFGVWIASAVADFARSSDTNEWWLLLVGCWLVLWTGYTCTKAMVLAHAAVWGQHPPKVRNPLRASLVFNGCTLGFVAAMAGARWLRGENFSTGLAATLLVFVVPFAFWLYVSRALPNRASGWLELAPGAALIAVGLQAMHLFTAYFLGPKLTSATQLYGVIGIATTMLFWFYLAGRLVIGAATINASLAEHRTGNGSPDLQPP